MTRWIATEEALQRLGVRPQTLYAYVSRGRLRAQPDPRDPRRSLYSAIDVDGLATRRTRSRRAADVAAEAIAWGEPVLESAISTVVDGRLFYRGRDAAFLAETETFEGVARLLRGVDAPPLQSRLRSAPPPGVDPRARLFAALAARAAADHPARGRSASQLAAEAATLLDVAADAVCAEVESGPIHERLGRAWSCGARGADLIRRSLVLLADHELNPSTFAARVTASTGASLAASALAGLSALTGPLHGGASEVVARLAAEADRVGAREAVAARLAFWTSTPGFGHPLYPEGDPRARALMKAFAPPEPYGDLGIAMHDAAGASGNVDFAISAMAKSLALPADAPFILFAVSRMAGWLAHAMEQTATGALIRPRARYVGTAPEL
ncbi:MAG TPA: citrate synthase [Caulobacteraceae bacterium]